MTDTLSDLLNELQNLSFKFLGEVLKGKLFVNTELKYLFSIFQLYQFQLHLVMFPSILTLLEDHILIVFALKMGLLYRSEVVHRNFSLCPRLFYSCHDARTLQKRLFDCMLRASISCYFTDRNQIPKKGLFKILIYKAGVYL